MIKHRIKIAEENDFLRCLQSNITVDFEAIDRPGFYIDFLVNQDELVVLVYGEKSLKTKIDEFVKHLNDHYINGGG